MKRLSGILILVLMSAPVAVSLASDRNPQKNKKTAVVRDSIIAVEKFRLKVVPPASGVQFYREGIVFLANSRSEKKMPDNHMSFGNVATYYAILSDTSIGTHTAFSPSYIYDVPCEGMTFNSDYSSMYYSKLASRREHEKIFHARYQRSGNGKFEWISDDRPLSFCSGSSAYVHPALSPDGRRMVFASNRSGTLGGFDLFLTTDSGAGWTAPRNLGNIFNTTGNEMFPFIDQENNLYFSSDGHNGLGGYDIFFCRPNATGWEGPVNMTGRVNSADDEIAFTLNRFDGKTAFFTRQMKSAGSSMSLYRISLPAQIIPQKFTSLAAAFGYISGAVKPVRETPAVSTQAAVAVKPKPEQEKTASVVRPVAKAQPAVTPAKDIVVYRIQFASLSRPKGSYEVTFAGKKYRTFEYRFNGAYRECAGEFPTLSQAAAFQKIVMKNGFPDAFVVAFKNNVRSTDPALFGK